MYGNTTDRVDSWKFNNIIVELCSYILAHFLKSYNINLRATKQDYDNFQLMNTFPHLKGGVQTMYYGGFNRQRQPQLT